MNIIFPATSTNINKARAHATSDPCIRISCMGLSISYGYSFDDPYEASTILSSPSSSSSKSKGVGQNMVHHAIYPLMIPSTMDTSPTTSMVCGYSQLVHQVRITCALLGISLSVHC